MEAISPVACKRFAAVCENDRKTIEPRSHMGHQNTGGEQNDDDFNNVSHDEASSVQMVLLEMLSK